MKTAYISKDEYITTSWAGGNTTQIIIYPNDKIVSNQDFIYRISSATVNLDSKFTKYNNYTRYLATLDNIIVLNENIIIKPLEPFKFEGSIDVSSQGICTDFNLICDKSIACNMEIFQSSFNKIYSDYSHYVIHASDECKLIVNNLIYQLNAFDSLAIYEENIELECNIKEGYIIVCSIAV